MVLRQEIAELKAMTNNFAISSSTTSLVHSCAPDNTKEPKVSMLEKFDGTRSKFRGFVMQVQLFLRMYISCYWNDSIQVDFVDAHLLGSTLS